MRSKEGKKRCSNVPPTDRVRWKVLFKNKEGEESKWTKGGGMNHTRVGNWIISGCKSRGTGVPFAGKTEKSAWSWDWIIISLEGGEKEHTLLKCSTCKSNFTNPMLLFSLTVNISSSHLTGPVTRDNASIFATPAIKHMRVFFFNLKSAYSTTNSLFAISEGSTWTKCKTLKGRNRVPAKSIQSCQRNVRLWCISQLRLSWRRDCQEKNVNWHSQLS